MLLDVSRGSIPSVSIVLITSLYAATIPLEMSSSIKAGHEAAASPRV